jgi:heparan-sulfate lyase
VHQTITLDGKDIDSKPRLRLFEPGNDRDLLVVENDGYENVTHRRSVFFVEKKFFVILDELLGRPRGNAWLHFQFCPGKAIYDKAVFSVRTGLDGGTNLLVKAMAQPGLELTEEEGRVSFKYGEQEPRPAFRFELRNIKGPVRFVTLLAPYREKVPAASIAAAGAAPGRSTVCRLRVVFEGRTYNLENR